MHVKLVEEEAEEEDITLSNDISINISSRVFGCNIKFSIKFQDNFVMVFILLLLQKTAKLIKLCYGERGEKRAAPLLYVRTDQRTYLCTIKSRVRLEKMHNYINFVRPL